LQQPSLELQQVSPQQLAQHAPLQQTCPLGQASPQVPQCAGSVWTSMHVPLQQSSPAAQTLPQPPQFFVSDSMSMQISLQQPCPVWQAPQSFVPPQPSEIVPH